jgi:hypothetical protein
MGRERDEQTWRQYGDPQGLFRVEIPASWSVQRTEGKLTRGQHGRIWEGEHSITYLHAPAGWGEERYVSVSIRIERYAEAPPPDRKGPPDPTDVGYFRRYRISHDADWLRCTVGHLRVNIQYEIQSVSGAYHSADWEPPAPLSLDERQERLRLVQRIIDSFELLAPS